MKQTWANLCEVKDFHNQKIWSKYAVNQYIYLQFAHKNLWNKNAILHTIHYKSKFNPNLEVQICYTFAKFVNLRKSIFSSSVNATLLEWALKHFLVGNASAHGVSEERTA